MPPDSTVSAPAQRGPAKLTDPFYYLHNFRWVVDWVVERYADLLNSAERRFAAEFQALPLASQGLLVRMVMRRGEDFRADKLCYSELGSTAAAVAPLVEQGWVEAAPVLDLETLFRLFTWPELRRHLAPLLAEAGVSGGRKGEALNALADLELEPASLAAWGMPGATVYRLRVMALCDRFRLMFFGNLHQGWSEFVLTELGTWTYEKVEFSAASRPFGCREDIDAYIDLQNCHERFHEGEPLEAITADLPVPTGDNPWLLAKRDRLLFKLGREWERAGELGRACELYHGCGHPEARGRLLRVLEVAGEYDLALALARQVRSAPQTEAEHQQLERLIPRLERKLGLPRAATPAKPVQAEFIDLALPVSPSVELAVQAHLDAPRAPVFYVENTLLTGLFGLLCWDAVFAPVRGAFFNPFQRGPADLYWPDFYRRRQSLFDHCLRQLPAGDYRAVILDRFEEKYGVQSPFVHWGAVTRELVEQALRCIPPEHLLACFERMLRDLKANCAGLPDLIQFWPGEQRYRMIEVKGPGDRLQDNQRRWLSFFAAHGMPVAVCHVRWAPDGAVPA